MFTFFLDLFFPRRSLTGEEGSLITEAERARLTSHPVTEATQELRSRGLAHIDRIVAASTYRDCPLLRKAVWSFKYRRIPGLAQELGALLGAAVQQPIDPDAVLVPVPLHWSRKFQRGFNQSELLARIVSAQTGLPMRTIVRRVRATGHQAWRSQGDRHAAMHSAFAAKENVPAHIILVDDIATTGATLDACAKELKNRGARSVEALVLAKVDKII